MAVRTRFFDDFFLTRGRRRRAAGGDPGLRAWTRAPTGCRGRTAPSSTRSTSPGDRGEDRDDDEDRRHSHRRPARRRGRPPRRLAGGAAAGGLRRRPAHGVERRGPAGVPAAGGAGPTVRRHHALSAPGSQLATEYHPDGGAILGERASAISEQWRDHGFDVNLVRPVLRGRAHARRRLSRRRRGGRCPPAPGPRCSPSTAARSRTPKHLRPCAIHYP